MAKLNFSKLLSTEVAETARKIIDFYDGKQQKHLIKLLSDPAAGRKDWRSRGIIPRHRNILKMIINKSGLIANDRLPSFEINDTAGSILNDKETVLLNQILVKANIEDLIKNNDSLIRALSSTKVLIQYDEMNDKFVFDILGLHNCATVIDEYHNLNTLIYMLSEKEDGSKRFRVFTNDLIQDIEMTTEGVEFISNSQPNLYGFIPVANFNDLYNPRYSDWNIPSSELVQINEVYNLHITDSEFALKFMKYGTWITNCEVSGTAPISHTSTSYPLDRSLPVVQSNGNAEIVVGPNQLVTLAGNNSDSPLFDWKSPVIDLKPLDEIVTSWVDSFATDWSVVIDQAGSADSGFKLIVKELPNLEMKKQRQKMQETGYEELSDIIMRISNLVKPGSFTEGSKPKVKFHQPILPVDDMQDEQVWSLRITSGRATRLDYFMNKFDMTKEQAEEKIAEIDNQRQAQQVSTLKQMVNAPDAPNVQKFMVGP